MVKERDRPPQPRRRTNGKWIAMALAILVNLAFVGVLVFSVTWRNPPAPAVSAELYAPPVRPPAPAKPEPPKPEPPKPESREPEPPKRKRRILAALVIAAGTALIVRRLSENSGP